MWPENARSHSARRRAPRARRPWSAAILALLCSSLALASPAGGQDEELPAGIAARGPGVAVSIEALDALLVSRHGMSEEGRSLFELLLKRDVLEHLAVEAELEIPDVEVSRRWSVLDRSAREAGHARGLLTELERNGFSVADFRDYLRLALVQEHLTQRALGLGSEDEVGGEQQEIWLQQEMAQRGLERLPPPWTESWIARCGSAEVTVEEFGAFLRERMASEKVNEAAAHLLLVAAIELRLPDLTPEARAQAIEAEIGRRREEHTRSIPGLTFEQRLGAAGRNLDQMRRDPAVQVAALSRVWVDRNHAAEGIRRAYEAERELFEGLHGRAVRAHLLFLVAGRFKNELNTRTFDEAANTLRAYAGRCGDVGDFRALCATFTEDAATRKTEGDLGWVTRAQKGIPAALRAALFEHLDREGEILVGGRALEPVTLDGGVGLLWISDQRPSPEWEVMAEHVHQELRRRFVERVLPGESVQLLR